MLGLGSMAVSGRRLFSGRSDAQDQIYEKDSINTEIEYKPEKSLSDNKLIIPPALTEKDIVAITAPASPTSYYEMRHALRMLKKSGFKIEVGKTIKDRKARSRYLSAPDDMRANEFMDYVQRDDVKCILCGRGGYGVMRILDKLDFNIIRDNPKIIVGFSDITALINAIHVKTNMVTYHGPVAACDFDSFTTNYFRKVLYSKEQFEPIKASSNSAFTLVKGKGEGKLVGGNLSMLSATLGTPYEINTDNAILFIEEVSEHPYKIDKMLTQLKLAGKFDSVQGIIFGYFKRLNTKRSFYPGGSFTIKQVLNQLIKPLGIPTVIGMPIGHGTKKITLPIGITAQMDAEKCNLVIKEQSVLA